MAIIGGAGNPVGGSFTGPAQALEIIGDHAYAYSGVLQTTAGSTADTTALSFTSGNYYFVGKLSAQSDETGAGNRFLTLSLNGQDVVSITWDLSGASSELLDQPLPIIIPPYTETVISVGAVDTDLWTVQLVGRIYRTRD